MQADTVARLLGVTREIRAALDLRTIGAVDFDKAARTASRKVSNAQTSRRAKAAKRSQTREEYVARSIAEEARALGITPAALRKRKQRQRERAQKNARGHVTRWAGNISPKGIPLPTSQPVTPGRKSAALMARPADPGLPASRINPGTDPMTFNPPHPDDRAGAPEGARRAAAMIAAAIEVTGINLDPHRRRRAAEDLAEIMEMGLHRYWTLEAAIDTVVMWTPPELEHLVGPFVPPHPAGPPRPEYQSVNNFPMGLQWSSRRM
jgi:hypothetical protein